MATETGGTGVPTWVRYGGLAAILASLLELVLSLSVGFVFPEAFEPGTRDALVVGDLVVTYLVLGVIGVAAVYGRYRGRLGWTGILGLLAIGVGAVLGIALTIVTGVVSGDLLNLILVFGGASLLAVALWRITDVPRSVPALMGLTPVLAVVGIAAALLAPTSPAGPVVFLVVNVIWGLAWILLGYHIWRSPRRGAGPAVAETTGT